VVALEEVVDEVVRISAAWYWLKVVVLDKVVAAAVDKVVDQS